MVCSTDILHKHLSKSFLNALVESEQLSSLITLAEYSLIVLGRLS